MNNIQREDIHLIGQHSNLDEKEMVRLLKNHVYNDREAWQKFLRSFSIGLGVAFTVLGIVFFFAYNWAELHKFTKMGLVETLLVLTIGMALFPKINTAIRCILLTGATTLVGVLFAVYGQIYQTGANAFDFFLAWTVFATLWTLVSNYSPLWLLYLVLINTTFILYAQQLASDWSEIFTIALLFGINTAFLMMAILISRYRKAPNFPNWFIYTVTLAAIGYATIGIIAGIYDGSQPTFPILIIMSAIVFAIGIGYGLKTRNGFYLAVIPFSLIMIISALLFKISNEESMFLLVALFIIGSITLVVKNLLALQKRWSHGK